MDKVSAENKEYFDKYGYREAMLFLATQNCHYLPRYVDSPSG